MLNHQGSIGYATKSRGFKKYRVLPVEKCTKNAGSFGIDVWLKARTFQARFNDWQLAAIEVAVLCLSSFNINADCQALT